MLTKTQIASVIFCASVMGVSAAPVIAQPDPATGTPPQADQNAEVSDSQLALYVQAAEKVAALQEQIQREMQQAETAEEAQQIQAGSQQRLIDAVLSLGMSIEDYNHIATLVQTNPEVQERARSLMQ